MSISSSLKVIANRA